MMAVRATAAKTVVFSGISVLIGFAVLGLANFSFYRSAVGSAVGVVILLAVLLTLNYFFVATLGEKLFWPTKRLTVNQRSRFWTGLSTVGIQHPLVTLGVLIMIAAAGIWNAPHLLNYNSADEISNHNAVKKGYLIAQRDFSKGEVAPTTIYLRVKRSLVNRQNLAALDQITRALKKEPGVKTVLSATQPTGTLLQELYVKGQLSTVLKNLGSIQSGLGQVKTGLQQAASQMQGTNLTSQLSKAQQLATASQQLANATSQLTSGGKLW